LNFEVPAIKRFELQGKTSATYPGMTIDSAAETTKLRALNITECEGMPLAIASKELILDAVSVTTSGIALVLSEDGATLSLIRDSNLTAGSGLAVVCKNLKVNSVVSGSAEGTLDISGSLYYCGTAPNSTYITISNGEMKEIEDNEFNKYVEGYALITFDPCGGNLADSDKTRTVYYGQAYGQLPTPTRESYGFDGWFTATDGGEQVTADVIVNTIDDRTLYAHWTLKEFTVTFNANGGTVDEATRSMTCGKEFGTLPVPARDGHTFDGWYDADGNKVTDTTTKMTAEDMTVTAKWILNEYKVTWNTGTGYSIQVNRTGSPVAGAATGALNNGDKVYYGDVLAVTYSASTGYSLSGKGEENITVTGDVSASVIFATAQPNDYTYNIEYKSSNGTVLETATAKHTYGTTNTITPPAFAGYNTPSAQDVSWDSVDAKTITFTYTPIEVATSQSLTSGIWMDGNGSNDLTFSAKAEYRNRTANSVQIRIVWTQTIKNAAYGYNQYFYISLHHNGSNRGNTGSVKIASTSKWPFYSNSGPWHSGSVTKESDWVTVSLDTTNATTVTAACDWWGENSSCKGSWSQTMSIPAY
jgi:uncharacterized repeat protein (TIGR02543 family)